MAGILTLIATVKFNFFFSGILSLLMLLTMLAMQSFSYLIQKQRKFLRKNKKTRMVIKINIKKAYDRVGLEFIEALLRAIDSPKFLRKIIMSTISNSTI
ncbi:hypothetical protein PVK06_009354 [Gossypium arboreum]|uniref:Reverse transcriptase n=1 Tax=Gossypium arboreum TaxID=29729 RepID=A0ABR0QNB2_GOSAR|nr:hypothetical protein PVK06_009354 [Gossypium arboreum]